MAWFSSCTFWCSSRSLGGLLRALTSLALASTVLCRRESLGRRVTPSPLRRRSASASSHQASPAAPITAPAMALARAPELPAACARSRSAMGPFAMSLAGA